MTVYERAAKGVPEAQKMGVYELYTARAAEFFGVPSTRPIYEVALGGGEWGHRMGRNVGA